MRRHRLRARLLRGVVMTDDAAVERGRRRIDSLDARRGRDKGRNGERSSEERAGQQSVEPGRTHHFKLHHTTNTKMGRGPLTARLALRARSLCADDVEQCINFARRRRLIGIKANGAARD
jgi:hypothetical protein